MSKRQGGGGYVDMEESKDGDERDFKIEADWKEQSQGTVQWQSQWQSRGAGTMFFLSAVCGWGFAELCG